IQRHTFYKHIGLYVYRRDFLLSYAAMPESGLERAERLEQLRILERGYRIKVGITQHDSVPIDTPDDVRRVIDILQTKR
ncbi:3-deoxy-manno-octulosonate cytidylyltransferase, partial [bacterium]